MKQGKKSIQTRKAIDLYEGRMMSKEDGYIDFFSVTFFLIADDFAAVFFLAGEDFLVAFFFGAFPTISFALVFLVSFLVKALPVFFVANVNSKPNFLLTCLFSLQNSPLNKLMLTSHFY